MDTRVELLKRFYNTMNPRMLKLEAEIYGFNFLDALAANDITLEYGQLSEKLIQKYKLLNLTEQHLNQFLQGHINKEYNVCQYFNQIANNIFCFNLDNNYKVNNTALIPETTLALKTLKQYLEEYALTPLVIASGRGYHTWCRLDTPVDNNQLFNFSIRIAAKVMASLHEQGYNYNKIKFSVYPNPRVVTRGSLRLFGSKHIKTKEFSYVYSSHGLLDETSSWKYFEKYLTSKIIAKDQFLQAHTAVLQEIQ
jgi:hypothetical protein